MSREILRRREKWERFSTCCWAKDLSTTTLCQENLVYRASLMHLFVQRSAEGGVVVSLKEGGRYGTCQRLLLSSCARCARALGLGSLFYLVMRILWGDPVKLAWGRWNRVMQDLIFSKFLSYLFSVDLIIIEWTKMMSTPTCENFNYFKKIIGILLYFILYSSFTTLYFAHKRLRHYFWAGVCPRPGDSAFEYSDPHDPGNSALWQYGTISRKKKGSKMPSHRRKQSTHTTSLRGKCVSKTCSFSL